LLRDYDIVSWDPRGVGQSTAVQCFASQAAENAFLGQYDSFPTGPTQQRAYIAKWREFGKICAPRGGALLKYLSTANTARDLNLLRQAFGQAKLDYLGLSYGTLLGATYANLFPHRVGRMVLDGNVAPEALGSSLSVGVATAAADEVQAFLRTTQHAGLRVLSWQSRRHSGQVGCPSRPRSPDTDHRRRQHLHLRRHPEFGQWRRHRLRVCLARPGRGPAAGLAGEQSDAKLPAGHSTRRHRYEDPGMCGKRAALRDPLC
jgi:pimeloyl-ACP methyl ester carboxylesterase